MNNEPLQHGGSEVYTLKYLEEDYSVTTNFMGPSQKGLNNVMKNISSINHYPPTDKKYFQKGLSFLKTQPANIIWGNGASELIDLTIRFLVKKFNYVSFSKGEETQFMEYERTCLNNGLYSDNDKGDILIIINPNNPTGKFMGSKNEYFLKMIDEKLNFGGSLIIDESMIFWLNKWEKESSMFNYILHEMLEEKGANIFVVHSWTKIFSCTGIRFGSIWSLNPFLIKEIENIQVPWSVNILAYHYLEGCLDDKDYLIQTRDLTSIYRLQMEEKLYNLFPFISIYGEKFLSWLWIDLKSEDLVNKVYRKLYSKNILIRRGKIGYKKNTFIRLAVRNEEKNDILFNCLEELKNDIFKPNVPFKIENDIIYGMANIKYEYLLQHENIINERKDNLKKYLENNDYFILPSIIACSKTLMIIDGHHRLDIYKEKNIKEIPVLLINYDSPNIWTHDMKPIDKDEIIASAKSGWLLPPKSTKHMILDIKNVLRPLISISVLIDLTNVQN